MTVSTGLLQRFSTAEAVQSSQQYSVLLADSDFKFRQGLRSLLDFYNSHSSSEYVVTGEAVSGAQVLHLSKSQRPNLVILDISLENSWEATVEVLVQLQQQNHAPNVLLVNDSQEPDYLLEGMQAGASGYLTKAHIATELLQAISTIAAGQIYLSAAMMNTFFCLFQSHAKQSLEKCKLLHLSKREQEVLKLLARGEPNEVIAKELFISVATVKSHFTSIFEKLGVKSRTQAIIRALRLGLV
ncbi:MAG: LuxR C-terminal-related transcriptional regulator [Leptolyngbyaceae cyanobacterium]